MAIFVYDKYKKKVVPIGEATEKVELNGDHLSTYINMRKTWSGTSKIEFSQTTIDQDIKDRNRGL